MTFWCRPVEPDATRGPPDPIETLGRIFAFATARTLPVSVKLSRRFAAGVWSTAPALPSGPLRFPSASLTSSLTLLKASVTDSLMEVATEAELCRISSLNRSISSTRRFSLSFRSSSCFFS